MPIAPSEKKVKLDPLANLDVDALCDSRNGIKVWRVALTLLGVINLPRFSFIIEFHQRLLPECASMS